MKWDNVLTMLEVAHKCIGFPALSAISAEVMSQLLAINQDIIDSKKESEAWPKTSFEGTAPTASNLKPRALPAEAASNPST